jgi:hypothetical protein
MDFSPAPADSGVCDLELGAGKRVPRVICDGSVLLKWLAPSAAFCYTVFPRNLFSPNLWSLM